MFKLLLCKGITISEITISLLKIFYMGFAIFILVVCIIALIGLCNSGSSGSTTKDKYSYTPPAKPYTPPYTPPKPEEDEMAKARSRFKAIERNRKHTVTVQAKRIVKKPLDWFVVKKAQDQISEAEKLIVQELNKYKVDWYREVAFEGLKFEYGYARYDFLILTPKGIHLIEYDGRSSHCTAQQKERDTLKDKFCGNNGIPLTRYNSKHYYHLEREIALLLLQYGIQKK
jgi:hypothetical protein